MSSRVCWQFLVKQRKARDETDWHVPTAGSERITEIPQSQAKRFITEYEWLGNAGAARYCYGLFYGERLAAVCCYAKPTARLAFAAIAGVKAGDVLQLCRGASTHWAPKHSGSMLISKSLKMLEHRKRPRLVVAYADPDAGEVGIVYQASNALYLGFTDSRGPGRYIINGRHYHPRSVHRIFGSARHEVLVVHDRSYVRVQRTKKHRYVYVLGSDLEKRRIASALSHWAQPYPKRESSSGAQALP